MSFERAARVLDIPHARALGMTALFLDERGAGVYIPYAPHLIGDPDTGVIHGGVITALLDNTCGMAVRTGSDSDIADEDLSIATLDLRIDYMRAARPGLDITAHAHCYKTTYNIAFVRGVAFDEREDDPVATCVAAFMYTDPRPVRG